MDAALASKDQSINTDMTTMQRHDTAPVHMPSVVHDSTALESVAGHPLTDIGLAVATTTAGAMLTGAAVPLLPLIPVLSKALAAGRQERRTKANLHAIEQVLLRHEVELQRMSDEKFALINEVVLAAMGSTNDIKLEYLRNAVKNVLSLSELAPQAAVVLGRVIRDMSAAEAQFLMAHQGAVRISLGAAGPITSPDYLYVDPNSDEALCVYGLLSLGVLTPGEAMYDSMGLLGFSRLAPQLVALLSAPVEVQGA